VFFSPFLRPRLSFLREKDNGGLPFLPPPPARRLILRFFCPSFPPDGLSVIKESALFSPFMDLCVLLSFRALPRYRHRPFFHDLSAVFSFSFPSFPPFFYCIKSQSPLLPLVIFSYGEPRTPSSLLWQMATTNQTLLPLSPLSSSNLQDCVRARIERLSPSPPLFFLQGLGVREDFFPPLFLFSLNLRIKATRILNAYFPFFFSAKLVFFLRG